MILLAQLKVNGYIESQIALEQNPLRNPSSLILEEEEDELEVEGLTPIAFLSYKKLYLTTQYKWKKASLGLRPKVSYYYYPELEEANFLKADIEQFFNLKWNKRWKIYEKMLFRKSQRSGADVTEELFSLPRSYNRFQALLGVEYKFARRWNARLESRFMKNTFLTEEEMSNYYNAMNVNMKLKRSFKKKHWLNDSSLDIKWQHRN